MIGRTSPARLCVDPLLEWQASVDDHPWAACRNVVDANWPYRPLERIWVDADTVAPARILESESPWKSDWGDRPWHDGAAMEDLYADCVRQADAAVGYLLGELEGRGGLEDTITIVTSDNGEGLGERSPVRDVKLREHGSGSSTKPHSTCPWSSTGPSTSRTRW